MRISSPLAFPYCCVFHVENSSGMPDKNTVAKGIQNTPAEILKFSVRLIHKMLQHRYSTVSLEACGLGSQSLRFDRPALASAVLSFPKHWMGLK